MTQSFKAERTLTADEVALPSGVDAARQAAFREAVSAAMEAYGGAESLPQDHAIDETVAPSDDGGTTVTVTVTLP